MKGGQDQHTSVGCGRGWCTRVWGGSRDIVIFRAPGIQTINFKKQMRAIHCAMLGGMKAKG